MNTAESQGFDHRQTAICPSRPELEVRQLATGGHRETNANEGIQ